MNVATRFLADERGADLVEYALIIAVLSLAAFAVIGGVGTSMKGLYQALQTKITGSAP